MAYESQIIISTVSTVSKVMSNRSKVGIVISNRNTVSTVGIVISNRNRNRNQINNLKAFLYDLHVHIKHVCVPVCEIVFLSVCVCLVYSACSVNYLSGTV